MSHFEPSTPRLVGAPEEFAMFFDEATQALRQYFARMEIDPSKAMIGIDDERYVLVRASAVSMDLLDTLTQLYADRGPREALAIGRSFLFDIAFTIGLHDARMMHEKLGHTTPIAKLSAGPVHFAFTGWALVNIWPQSQPTTDDDFCLVYDHPYSFEAASFIHAGRTSEGPVCVMNAAYSSGWCMQSFGIYLTSVELKCKARGDDKCVFVMAPPHRVAEHVRKHFGIEIDTLREKGFDVPTYFERKHAEDKLRQAQDELVRKERLATVGLLVAGVAHEVNTPLGVAITAVSVLQDERTKLETLMAEDKLTKKDLREYLERTGKALELTNANLTRTAAQVTNFKKLSIDHATHEKRHVDLKAYVQQTIDNLKPVIRKSGMDVVLDAKGELEVELPPGVLGQIVTNLVMNSATHGGQGLHVRLQLQRRDGKVCLAYSDDGAGMSEDVQRQAFQPFFTTKRAAGGSGLGLHIVQSLVADVLGGRVELYTRPGQGVRFEITFPV